MDKEELPHDFKTSTDLLFWHVLFRPQIVRENMICHSIIGNSIGKEVIMRVNVKAEFISPLLQFSERKINFCVLKVSYW